MSNQIVADSWGTGTAMQKVFFAAFVLLQVGLCLTSTVPDVILDALKDSAAKKLGEEINRVQKAFEDAYNAFKPINKTCNHILQTKTDKCTTCVTNACKNRAEKACAPSKFEAVLAHGMQFFSKDIPNFLSKTIPHVFVDKLGKAVVDVGVHIKDLFAGSIKHVAVDVGKSIGKGAVSIGKGVINGVVDVGKGIEHVGEEIGHGIVHVGEEIGHGVIDLGSKIGDIGKDIGKGVSSVIHKIGSIFGRKRELLIKRSGEPSCDAIQNHDGCQYYFSKCADCSLDPAKECPGYKVALAKAQSTNDAQAWLAKVTNWTINIMKITVDDSSFDPVTHGYKKVEVTMNLLGKNLKFSVRKPLNPYNPTAAGEIIILEAIQKFKQAL